MTVRSRPTRALPYLLALLLGAGAAGLTACGQATNPAMVPASNADQLKADLDDVGAAISAQDCARSATALSQLQTDLSQLPRGTSKRLVSALRNAAATLATQSAKECQQKTSTQTTPTVTTVTTTTTDTTPTTTTDTTPTTTTPT
ncbi:MAG: hypothetical protein QOG68_1511, partial [Solirubrobacteraceae bacterium]|nr:hypothetical protein [Solirubrobacteraceae bacterium]